MRFLCISLLILILSGCESNRYSEIDSILPFDGNEIHYKTVGIGQEMIMVHGGFLDLDMWEPQVEYFEDTYRITRFSDLGHGKTVSKNFDIMGYEIIDSLSNPTIENPTILVGLSWGAMLCVDYAINYPDKVDKLVLVSPGLNGWDYFSDSIAAVNNQLRQVATQENRIRDAARLFHKNWVVGPRRVEKDLDSSFYHSSYDMINSNMNKHWKENWSQLDSTAAISQLEKISCPVYIIIGEHDAHAIHAIADIYERRISNSDKIIMPDVAHLLTWENHKYFNLILNKILKN